MLAGCSGSPSQSTGTPTPTDATTPDTTPTPHVTATSSGFAVDGPKLTPLDGSERSLFEDDGVKVAYSVMQPASASGAASFFVTFLYNGDIIDTQTVQLGPGESKAFEKSFPNVTGLKEVSAEVRAGSSDAKAVSPVKNWPRLGTPTAVEALGVDVPRAGLDATDGSLVVNVSLSRPSGAPQTVSDLRAALLCVDATGALATQGAQSLPLPDAGTTWSADVRFAPCPHATRGLALTGTVVATGHPALLHVIFPEGSVGTYVAPAPPA